jgi:hypothetical protein
MSQLTSVLKLKDFGFQALFATQASSHIFELLPPAMARDLMDCQPCCVLCSYTRPSYILDQDDIWVVVVAQITSARTFSRHFPHDEEQCQTEAAAKRLVREPGDTVSSCSINLVVTMRPMGLALLLTDLLTTVWWEKDVQVCFYRLSLMHRGVSRLIGHERSFCCPRGNGTYPLALVVDVASKSSL